MNMTAIALGAGLVAVALFDSSARAAGEAKIDTAAPPFTLTDTHGKEVSLDALKGKIVVLEWFNHDCPFVKKHYDSGNMPRLQATYTGKGVVWLSVNSSAPGKQGNYSTTKANELSEQKKSAATAVLLDGDGAVGRLYGAKTTPHMFVIDGAGILRYAGAIDSIASADAADVAKAENYVAAALDSLLAGRAVSERVTQSYGCSVKY